MTERNLLVLLQKLKKQNLDEKYAKYLDTYVYKKREDQDLMAPCKNCKPIESVIEPEPTESFKNQRSSTEVRSKPPYSTIMPKEHANLLPCIELSKLPHEEVHTLRLTIKNALDFNKEEVLGSGCFDYLCNKKLKYILGSALSITNLTIPTRRLPLYTDLMYMSEAQFKLALELFENLCRKIGDDENSESSNKAIDELLGCREIIILCMFLEFENILYENDCEEEYEDDEEQEPHFIRIKMIKEGYTFFLQQCHDHGIEKTAEFIHEYGSDLDIDQTRVASVFVCDRREISNILQIMYMDVYKSDFFKNFSYIITLFEFHPIFIQMTAAFYLCKIGFGMEGDNFDEKSQTTLREQASVCGIFLRNCYQTGKLQQRNTQADKEEKTVNKAILDLSDVKRSDLSTDEQTILDGLELYGRMSFDDFDNIADLVAYELEYLLHNESNLGAISKQSLFLSNVIYIPENDIDIALRLYHETAMLLDTIPTSEVIDKFVSGSHREKVLGFYIGMRAKLCKLADRLDNKQHFYKNMTIIQGYHYFLAKSKEYKCDFTKVADYLTKYGPCSIVTESTHREIIHILKAMEKYRAMFEKGGLDRDFLFKIFSVHPIYTVLTATFYLIKQGFALMGTGNVELSLQMIHDRILNCGLLFSESTVTETFERIKSTFSKEYRQTSTPAERSCPVGADLSPDDLDDFQNRIYIGIKYYQTRPSIKQEDIFARVKYMLRTEDSDLPPLACHRSPESLDLMYLTESSFKAALKLYFKLASQIPSVRPKVIIKKILKNRNCAIVGFYLGGESIIYRRVENKKVFNFFRNTILIAYNHFLDQIKEFDGNYFKMYAYFIEYGTFLAEEEMCEAKSFKECEIVQMLKSMEKYEQIFSEDQEKFVKLFIAHPIYMVLTSVFYMISEATRLAKPESGEELDRRVDEAFSGLSDSFVNLMK